MKVTNLASALIAGSSSSRSDDVSSLFLVGFFEKSFSFCRILAVSWRSLWDPGIDLRSGVVVVVVVACGEVLVVEKNMTVRGAGCG